MTSDGRRSVGARGEDIAAEHLERTGWRILERNYRVREGEIDLIATRGQTLAFCEVKTIVARATVRAGPIDPIEAVGPRKQARVRRMARAWLNARAATGQVAVQRELRLDVIGVVVSASGELMRLQHVEGAF